MQKILMNLLIFAVSSGVNWLTTPPACGQQLNNNLMANNEITQHSSAYCFT